MLREQYLHPNGQIPAYEWNFGDVNPPVHAWSTIFTYRLEKARTGKGDIAWLERCFHKLLLNFTWWINRKDADGKNRFAIVQAEDEIASISMVMGAGWAGSRAFTCTSGPGVSLMTEFAPKGKRGLFGAWQSLTVALGLLAGTIGFVGTVYWTATVVQQFGGLATPLAIVAMLLLSLYLGLFPAVASVITAAWTQAGKPTLPVEDVRMPRKVRRQ